MIIFPRLVWSIIFRMLSYSERCNLRAVCKSLATLPNREPLKYWLECDDPVVQNFKDVILKKLQNGIRIGDHRMYYEYVKPMYSTAHYETFLQYYKKISKIVSPRYYTAYKNKRWDILKYVEEKNKHPVNYQFIKYAIATDTLTEDVDILKSCCYCFLIKFNKSPDLISYVGKCLPAFDVKISQLKNIAQMPPSEVPEIIRYFVSRDWASCIYKYGFLRACKNNLTDFAEMFLPYVKHPDNFVLIADISKLLRLKKISIVLSFIKNLDSQMLANMVFFLVNNDHFWKLKLLVLSADKPLLRRYSALSKNPLSIAKSIRFSC